MVIINHKTISLLISNIDVDISDLLPKLPMIVEYDAELKKGMVPPLFQETGRCKELRELLKPIKETYGILSYPFSFHDAVLYCADKKIKADILEIV